MKRFVNYLLVAILLVNLVYSQSSQQQEIINFKADDNYYSFFMNFIYNDFYIDGAKVNVEQSPAGGASRTSYKIPFQFGDLLEVKDNNGNVVASLDISSYKKVNEVVYPPWSCQKSNSQGEIEIKYVNENVADKTEIFAITPQKYPIIYPGAEVVAQLTSTKCEEFTLAIKGSNGITMDRYLQKPYSPYTDCNNIPSDDISKHLTMIKFYLPDSPGKYLLEVTNPQGIVLTQGEINILDPTTSVSLVSKQAICSIDNSDYRFVLGIPYPLLIKPGNNYEKVSLVIQDSDTSKIRNLFDKIDVTVSSFRGENILLNKEANINCSNVDCTQKFELTSASSSSGILYIWQQTPAAKYTVLSSVVGILDFNKLKEIQLKLENLANVANQYSAYYDSIGDTQKADYWRNTHNKFNPILNRINILIPNLENGNLKISDVVELITFIDSQKKIDEIINSLQV